MNCKLYVNSTEPSVINKYIAENTIMLFNSGNAQIYICEQPIEQQPKQPDPPSVQPSIPLSSTATWKAKLMYVLMALAMAFNV